MSSTTQLTIVTPRYEEGEELKWDLQLIRRLNENVLEAEKRVKCTNNDFTRNIMELKKYNRINDMATHIYFDETHGLFRYNDTKLQMYKVDKSEKKTQYSFGFKTLSRPRLCYMWDKAQIKLCKGAFGDFHVMSMTHEASLINIMEQIMGGYMHKVQRQSEPIPITMEEGLLLSVPKDLTNKERFMSRFYVLNSADNANNIENNNIDEPMMISRMPPQLYADLFKIDADKKVSESRDFIVCTVFNGVEEKTKINTTNKESQCLFSLWLTPIVFVYVNN
ncbi:dbp [Clostera anastomosis granulovirus A]|uniref:Dbp n=1 Tax=Clostera anastomosis granulovirus A TaxID=1986289 RepID=U5KAU4_9BBAC|nr:dbp [Clostera anastomosis granulovirus Henan]AGQ20327.1 dbp [Clostera anastomosis granulovirus Henan]